VRAWLAVALPLLAAPVEARDLVGRYRLTEGPDVAGQLELSPDGRFGYEMAAGALDERAQGRWEEKDGRACLTTEPRPVPAELKPVPAPRNQTATVRVTWADGQTDTGKGVPGVQFMIGFDSGPMTDGYTQEDGWTLPPDEKRTPRWIVMLEPIYRTALARTPFTGRRFHALLVPHDMGVVDFAGACLEAQGDRFVLRRAEGEMRFRKAD